MQPTNMGEVDIRPDWQSDTANTYRGHTMKSLDEFVMTLEDIVSPKFASEIISEYVSTAEWRPYDKNKGSGGAPVKAILLSHPLVLRKSARRKKMTDDIVQAVGKAFDLYHAKHSRREQGHNFLHIEKLVGLRLIRYEIGQFMINHTDKYPDQETGKVYWPAVSVSINLTDDFTGGALNLLDGEILFNAKSGGGVFFPANFLYPHSVEKVTQGTRYSLVGWFM
jgi:predicted 2-oxoglutarate/Fe(II)-dependent dioxygenase YbiX